MKIIGTESSPFTRKVRVVAMERGIPAQFVVDSPFSAESLVMSLNPLGKVPVLVTDQGAALIDSSLIVAWLDTQGEGGRLIPARGVKRTAALQWEAVADGVMDAAVLMRVESLRAENERSPAWVERQRAKAESGMAWMDRHLAARAWCAGRGLSLASIAMGCCLSYLQFRFAEAEWEKRFGHVAGVCAELEKRASFVAAPLRG